MRVSNAAHERHPWKITEIAPDFDLLDVWALPIEGDRSDFPAVFDTLMTFDPVNARSKIVRFLFFVRIQLGKLFGWDERATRRTIPGSHDARLRARVPEDLRATAEDVVLSDAMRQTAGGFEPLYVTDDECAAEISNGTVHGVLHIGWVEQADGRYRAQMGIYVKPRGTLGKVYLKLIEPFRHYVVYPALMRQLRRAWRARTVIEGES